MSFCKIKGLSNISHLCYILSSLRSLCKHLFSNGSSIPHDIFTPQIYCIYVYALYIKSIRFFFHPMNQFLSSWGRYHPPLGMNAAEHILNLNCVLSNLQVYSDLISKSFCEVSTTNICSYQ